MLSQKQSKKTITGKNYRLLTKKLKNIGNLPTLTKLGNPKTKTIKIRSGYLKTRLIEANLANVYDSKAKKHKKVKIEAIIESPANRHYVRRNIITKGTIIKTELGNARVTSRPGQEPIINAVLVK